MANDADPYRTLGLSRGATLDEVRRAYRRLAKANHPDAAGERALPRFLAIRAAYDQIVGPEGGRNGARRAAPGRGTAPGGPWQADPDRAGATHRAYGGRTRRPRPGAQRSGTDRTSDSTSRPASSRSAGDRGRERPPRPPNKATLGSTSYDGAEGEPFEPDWGGASWYGTSSGTYWTLNPKEYADPRKHGPEYQARARRSRQDESAGEPVVDTDPQASGEVPPPSGGPALSGTPPRHTTTSWWDATTASPNTDEAPRQRHGAADPTHAPRAPGADPARLRSPELTLSSVGTAIRAWLDDDRPEIASRVVRAVVGWAPIALGIGWAAGEFSGCSRFAADCDPAVTPLAWLVQVAVLGVLLLVPIAARVSAFGTLVTLAAAVPGTLFLTAAVTPDAMAGSRAVLGGLLVIAWATGIGYGVARADRRRPTGPRDAPSDPRDPTGPVS